MQKILLALLALALFLPNLFDIRLHEPLAYNGKEKFDYQLSHLQSVDQLENYTDSVAATKHIKAGTYEYVELLGNMVESRFYHGFSHFSLCENWIAAIAGKLLKEDYACKVEPGEIMQHDNAACSQQALVMMQVLRDKHITYRSLGFPHHYAMEVETGGEWYFFDANMEPVITKQERALSSWQHYNDKLKPYYNTVIHRNLEYQFGNGQKASAGEINEVPAQNAKVFHTITGILSKIAWLLPLVILLYKGGFNIDIPFVSVMAKKRKPLISLPA